MSKETIIGYRAIISLGVSMLLKVLALKGVIQASGNTAENVSLVTDAAILMISGIFDFVSIWFKLHSPVPGPLSEQGKARAMFLKYGISSRKDDDEPPAKPVDVPVPPPVGEKK